MTRLFLTREVREARRSNGPRRIGRGAHFRIRFFILLEVLSLSGCGYTLQTSDSKDLEKEGIRKVFVSPLVNNTYKAGVENLVYNALVKTLASHKKVIVVQSIHDADATLSGTITNATFAANSTQFGNTLSPSGFEKYPKFKEQYSHFGSFSVAATYRAFLGCHFYLMRRNPPPGKRAMVWNMPFAKDKPYNASNQLGPMGTTSALINESEFDRALSDLAISLMEDVHESMLARF